MQMAGQLEVQRPGPARPVESLRIISARQPMYPGLEIRTTVEVRAFNQTIDLYQDLFTLISYFHAFSHFRSQCSKSNPDAESTVVSISLSLYLSFYLSIKNYI